MISEIKIFSGNANPELASKIAGFLDCEVGNAHVNKWHHVKIGG